MTQNSKIALKVKEIPLESDTIIFTFAPQEIFFYRIHATYPVSIFHTMG